MHEYKRKDMYMGDYISQRVKHTVCLYALNHKAKKIKKERTEQLNPIRIIIYILILKLAANGNKIYR